MPVPETRGLASEAAFSPYEERCRLTLETALGRTPLYEAWRDRDPGASSSVDERFASLPILTKDDIRAFFPYGLVPRGLDLDAALSRGEVSFVSTSGTSDDALQNIWNQRWWDQSERSSWALNSVASRVATGAHREAILASALSVGPRTDAGPLDRKTRTLGRFVFLNEYGSTADWPKDHEKRMLAELAELQPAVVEANPSLLARLARYAARTGAAVWQPSLIVFTYEFISALHLRDIRAVFSSPTASSYGSTEAGYVFMECEHGSLHQNTDSCRVDFAPVAGLPGSVSRRGGVGPGSRGKILATTFGNEWFPLVRFEIGDIGLVARAPCPCGRTAGLTLSAIEGRLKSLCVAADGRTVAHRELDNALAQVDGLEQYRLDQDSPKSVKLSIIPKQGKGARVASDARDALAIVFGARVSLAVEIVGELRPEKSGKFLLVHRSFPLDGPHV